ncbi:hypothetical protein JIN85_04585 [Luteolibacter pohnpeiensis]|uniref:Uncharacterized protein n=1 Tax=Luteolibacter pohnpeiensis TaxID=454153 RepID=A0A934VTN9_9BACT|nr:hypothetical protein [Luteolibacter pohnpeiensis]MBK1881677.1 hypothetical protein [Luteolibacter pohnpeiensis]
MNLAYLDTRHALSLLLLALAVGILSLMARQAAGQMVRSPEEFRKRWIRRIAEHPLAILFQNDRDGSIIRKWGITFSRLALFYVIFSFSTAIVLLSLLIMNHLGFHDAIAPIAEFLAKFESGLSC